MVYADVALSKRRRVRVLLLFDECYDDDDDDAAMTNDATNVQVKRNISVWKSKYTRML